jgi:hypothetical protein
MPKVDDWNMHTEQCWNDTKWKEPKYLKKNFFLYYYIYFKPHVDCPRIETQPPQWEAGDLPP